MPQRLSFPLRSVDQGRVEKNVDFHDFWGNFYSIFCNIVVIYSQIVIFFLIFEVVSKSRRLPDCSLPSKTFSKYSKAKVSFAFCYFYIADVHVYICNYYL